MSLTRRDLLKLGGAALGTGVAGARLAPVVPPAEAQTPMRGGVFRVCAVADPTGAPHERLARQVSGGGA